MQNDWNSIVLRGEIEEEPSIYCYNSKENTTNYLINLKVKTKGEQFTVIPVLLPTNAENIDDYKSERGLFVKGTVITHRVYDEKSDKNVLKTIVRSRVIDFLEEGYKPLNSVIVTGYLVSKEEIWQNVNGSEYIVFLVASNRNDKSNYIRCLAKFDRAHYIDEMEVGEKIEIHGFMYQNFQRKDYTVKSLWIKGFDKPYRNKAGVLFGGAEE